MIKPGFYHINIFVCKHSDINHVKVSRHQAWEFTTGRGCCLWITPKPGLPGFVKANESKLTDSNVNSTLNISKCQERI
jgi:hypothetical protein